MSTTNTSTSLDLKPDITLYDYIANINVHEKLLFYEETYQVYIKRLLKTDEKQALKIKEYEEIINKDGTEMLHFIFKRIVPTLNPSDCTPFILLYCGLNDVHECSGLDALCVFLQIAGFRWSQIERSFSSSSNTRNWRDGNKWIKTPEGKLLVPLFDDARQEAKGEYKVSSFNDIYLASILPMLIEHKNVLFSVYNSFIKYREDEIKKDVSSSTVDIEKRKEEIHEIEEERSRIKSIYKEDCSVEEKKRKIYDIISENPRIQDHFQYEYRNFCKSESFIYFKSANRSFYLSELEETLWKKLPPWPDLKDCLTIYHPFLQDVLEFSVPKKESLDFLKKEIKTNDLSSKDIPPPPKPQGIQTIKKNEKKKTLPKTVFVDSGRSSDKTSDDPILANHEIISGFYNELYLKFIEYTKKTNDSMSQIIQESVSFLSERDDLGMVLHMFKKIAPTLCDERIIEFLMIAIKEADELHDFNRISTFMQIASFRWAFLENGFKTRASTKRGQEGKSLIDSPENRFFGAAFGLMLDSPDYKYDVDKFNQCYKQVIIFPLVYLSIQFAKGNVVEGKDLLHKYLSDIAKEHPEECEQTNEVYSILKKGKKINEEDICKMVDIASRNEFLRRKIRDKCRRWCNAIQEMNKFLWFESVGRGFDLLDLEETYWKKLPPWPIDDILNGSQTFANYVDAVMKESIALT